MDHTTPPAGLPDDAAVVRQQFADWRQTRVGQGKISDELWAAAIRVATKYGVHPAAKMIQVDYKCLKARVREAEFLAGLAGAEDAGAPLTFVEVRPAPPGGSIPAGLTLDLEQLLCGIAGEES